MTELELKTGHQLKTAFMMLSSVSGERDDPELTALNADLAGIIRRYRILMVTHPAQAMPEQSQSPDRGSGDTLS